MMVAQALVLGRICRPLLAKSSESDWDSECGATGASTESKARYRLQLPPRKKRKQQWLCFKEEWKLRFIMLPASVASSKSRDSEDVICVQCQEPSVVQQQGISNESIPH